MEGRDEIWPAVADKEADALAGFDADGLFGQRACIKKNGVSMWVCVYCVAYETFGVDERGMWENTKIVWLW